VPVWSVVVGLIENRLASMILHEASFTLGIWLLICNFDLFQQPLVKFDSLSLKVISKVVISFPAHLELIGYRVNLVIEDALILSNEGKSLHDFEIVLVDILDFEVDSIHLIDSLDNLILFGHRFFL
jgi:hypothetical protein